MQFDSTVSYDLEDQETPPPRTAPASPRNTYAKDGLPDTPILAVDRGIPPWRTPPRGRGSFVRQGWPHVFTTTEEHRCDQESIANGVLTQPMTPAIAHRAGSGDPSIRARRLHNAGYARWPRGLEYGRFRCAAEDLPGIVGSADASRRLLGDHAGQVRGPGFRDEATDRGPSGRRTRAHGDGWRADNTDCDGVTGALRELGAHRLPGRAVLVGPAAQPDRRCGRWRRPAARVSAVARSDASTPWSRWRSSASPRGCSRPESPTSPGRRCPGLHGRRRRWRLRRPRAPRILDVIYDPWPTPLVQPPNATTTPPSAADHAAHQALGQFEQFTSRPAPEAAMREALSG